MKIYILKTAKKLQPGSQKIEYPVDNDDYGVEQDFLQFLKHSPLLTDKPEAADWHYLPIFWTRWHLNHDYGKKGLNELQQAVDATVIDPKKTFTICQYDDGPLAKLGPAKMFLASRKGAKGIDIPLLRNDLRRPILRPLKRYKASFVGRLSTHPVRQKMATALKDRDDVCIYDGDKGQKFFVDTALKSYAALCPRGYGGSSFRLFEAMQLGVVPILIGDQDTRPFKQYIDWDQISLHVADPQKLSQLLDSVSNKSLKKMGLAAKQTYQRSLRFGRWCTYVIKELEAMS